MTLSDELTQYLHAMVEKQVNTRVRCGMNTYPTVVPDSDKEPVVKIDYVRRSGRVRAGFRKTWHTAVRQYVEVGQEWFRKHWPDAWDAAVMRAALSGSPVPLPRLDVTPCPVLLSRSEQWAIDAEAEEGRLYAD